MTKEEIAEKYKNYNLRQETLDWTYNLYLAIEETKRTGKPTRFNEISLIDN